MMAALESLSLQDFRVMIAELLDLDLEQVTPEAYFITDLGVDSVRLVEVLLYLEKIGIEIYPDLAWQIETVGDAFNYYQSQVEAKRDR
jgi:acyl carrier protein